MMKQGRLLQTSMKWGARLALVLAGLGCGSLSLAADLKAGQKIYEASCVVCHASGVAGAPKMGDAAAWKPRIAQGIPALVKNATMGKGAMPAKGGNATLSDADMGNVVAFMAAESSGNAGHAAPAAANPATQSAALAANASAAATAATAANHFNRLLRPSQRNRPPVEDGIHDADNDGTVALQAPLTAFGTMPKANAGNRVDWVKALAEGKIAPRADRVDPNAVPVVMDLNIVREVKGSMPDVVYPHKQHTEWLDCSNCHPAIFKPQKGANQISMASILLGEACGVCHGKVAFPVSECRLCHSKPKANVAAK